MPLVCLETALAAKFAETIREALRAFGTFTDFMHGRDLAEQKQWRNVWGTIRNFRYDLDKVEAIVSGDRLMATGMAVWSSNGFHPNGDHFDREPVHVEYRDPRQVVIANDGTLLPGDRVAISAAQQLHLALKNKSGGGIDPHAGHDH